MHCTKHSIHFVFGRCSSFLQHVLHAMAQLSKRVKAVCSKTSPSLLCTLDTPLIFPDTRIFQKYLSRDTLCISKYIHMGIYNSLFILHCGEILHTNSVPDLFYLHLYPEDCSMSVPGELPHFHYKTHYDTMLRQRHVAVKLMDMESDSPRFKYQSCHSLCVSSWACCLTSCLIWKIC